MKCVYLIGKFTPILQDVLNTLKGEYEIQICSDRVEIVSGIIGMRLPDLFVVSTAGFETYHLPILNTLKYEHPEIPVIMIGTNSECDQYTAFFKSEQFTKLIRPVPNNEILDIVSRRINHLEIKSREAEGELSEQKPLVREGEEVVTDAEESGREAGTAPRKCVLIIDDNPLQLRLFKSMLDKNYYVKMAKSGQEALDIIRRKRPDLIYLDYDMPGMDGKQTLAAIREEENGDSIPVVFVTGVKDPAHIKAVVSLKPSGYILKPVDESTLNTKAASILGE